MNIVRDIVIVHDIVGDWRCRCGRKNGCRLVA